MNLRIPSSSQANLTAIRLGALGLVIYWAALPVLPPYLQQSVHGLCRLYACYSPTAYDHIFVPAYGPIRPKTYLAAWPARSYSDKTV